MRLRRSLHERLVEQPALVGFLQTHPSPSIAELAGICKYDFLLLDAEHGVFSDSDLLHALRAFSAMDGLVMVRLSSHNTQALGKYMDFGADVIVVPNVTTADEARTLVRAMEYPPTGTRGFGAPAHRATRYGIDLAAHVNAPRDGVCLLPIIESTLGVANVDEILAVDGVDGVIVGPSDLSANLGCLGEYSQPAYAQAMASIEHAARVRGKLLGTAPNASSPMEALFDRGHRLFIVGADMPLIREAMCAQVAQALSTIKSRCS
jgi:4-hydroxy-2-oxoheptanedioate aldolase